LVVGGVHHNKTVHRLVLRAFTGTDGSVVNHINGLKHDNRLENLEWSTTSENAKHSFRVLGRAKPSGTLGKTLLSVRKHVLQSTTDGMWVRVWRGIQEAGDAGYSTTAISNVLHGRVRSHAGFNWSFFGE